MSEMKINTSNCKVIFQCTAIQTPPKIPEETTEKKNDAHKAMEIQADNMNFPSN